MTPKEKAIDLVEKLASPLDVFKINIKSKQCALIAVDEILEIGSVIVDYNAYDYWQEVKQEIEEL